MKKVTILLSILIVLVAIGITTGLLGLSWQSLNSNFSKDKSQPEEKTITETKIKVVTEESAVIEAVNKVGPSVITVSVIQERQTIDFFDYDPLSSTSKGPKDESETIEQDVGTGFIISKDGLIVTNKHVVSIPQVKYQVITKDDKIYQVEKIYRDPVNDLAIIKINPAKNTLKPAELGDSSKLRVGQFVIAIGTALGKFRHTVTTGVISGLGRGIIAGNAYQSHIEELDNVIQTDAAINPGNSGGPLLNSAGQVIGVNVAMVLGSENIGFAIPINVVKDSLDNFNRTGKFSRPFLGVRFEMISRRLSLMNEIPEGAYIQDIIKASPADKAGIQPDDIITKIDGQKITEDTGGLAKIISRKKVGDKLTIEIYRNDKKFTRRVTLEESDE